MAWYHVSLNKKSPYHCITRKGDVKEKESGKRIAAEDREDVGIAVGLDVLHGFQGLRAFRGNGKVHLGVVRHVGGICGFGEGNRAQLQSAAGAPYFSAIF